MMKVVINCHRAKGREPTASQGKKGERNLLADAQRGPASQSHWEKPREKGGRELPSKLDQTGKGEGRNSFQ